jgi:hypothetical protein
VSFRLTAVLVVIFAALGGYVYFYGPKQQVKASERPPYLYEIDLSDIVHLDVTHQGKRISMDWDDDKDEWRFLPDSSVQGKVDQLRVNGLRLLLSGPGSKRVLFADKVADIAEFGLTRPFVVANVTTKEGYKFRVLVGDQTPNGQSHYVKLEDYDPVYLVDYTWGNELARFVNEPPVTTEEPAS